MSLVPWAKVTMALQSFISMGILALVVARAVNVFTEDGFVPLGGSGLHSLGGLAAVGLVTGR
jgi:hypothetical protein